MKIKKLMIVGLSALIMATTVGCGNKDTTKEKEVSNEKTSEKLTFMTNVVGEQALVIEGVIKDFEKETGYEVEFSAPGKSYEELMKTKMASKELPDVFSTHGWSVARYSEYLMPVNDMEFAYVINEQIKPVITDKDGNMFVLPMDMDIAGMVYNVSVLEEAGVNVDDIKTWQDFADACEKIKAIGKTPMHVGGKDNWTIGQIFDWIAPSFYITDENNNKSEELVSGKFDKQIWESVAGLIDKWTKAGYFNKDVLTSDYNSDVKALAEGEAAFVFYGNSSMIDVHKLNPQAKLGMMPIPSNSPEDQPSLIAGERVAVGVWKDSPHKDAAIELLNYLARPEVMKKVATASGNPAGLTSAESDIGDIQQYYDKYKNIETFPYFDRAYLPSGMWDVMCSTGADILAGKQDSASMAATVMEQNFNDKFTK